MPDQPKSHYHQELERRANDLLRVYNPTNAAHVVEWSRRDGTKLFRVPPDATNGGVGTTLIRYIAEKYLREMFDLIITRKADASVIAENEKRITKGMEEMTKWKDQLKFESQFYNPTLDESKKLLASLYGGVVQEFGVDKQAQSEVANAIPDDKPAFAAAWEAIEKSGGTAPAILDTTSQDLPDTSTPDSGETLPDQAVQSRKARAMKGVSAE